MEWLFHQSGWLRSKTFRNVTITRFDWVIDWWSGCFISLIGWDPKRLEISQLIGWLSDWFIITNKKNIEKRANENIFSDIILEKVICAKHATMKPRSERPPRLDTRLTFNAVCLRWKYSLLDRVWLGAMTIESPVCTPRGSKFCTPSKQKKEQKSGAEAVLVAMY